MTSDEIYRFISLRFSNLSRYFLVERKTQEGKSIQSLAVRRCKWRTVRKITVFVARIMNSTIQTIFALCYALCYALILPK